MTKSNTEDRVKDKPVFQEVTELERKGMYHEDIAKHLLEITKTQAEYIDYLDEQGLRKEIQKDMDDTTYRQASIFIDFNRWLKKYEQNQKARGAPMFSDSISKRFRELKKEHGLEYD